MWNKVNELSRESLYQRHEKQTKNPTKTTGNRYRIGTLRKGLSAASLGVETLKDNH